MEKKTPLVSLIMGSTSDYPTMEAAAKFLNEQEIPFEILALSAHRTPHEVFDFAQNAAGRGVKVIIAGAGMAAHLPPDPAAGHRRAYQIEPGRHGCRLGHAADASGNPGGHGSHQRGAERGYLSLADAVHRRGRTVESLPPETGRLQGRTQEQDQESQRGLEKPYLRFPGITVVLEQGASSVRSAKKVQNRPNLQTRRSTSQNLLLPCLRPTEFGKQEAVAKRNFGHSENTACILLEFCEYGA